MSNARTNRNPVAGILTQFKELVGVLAVALCDAEGEPIALVGEDGATGALACGGSAAGSRFRLAMLCRA